MFGEMAWRVSCTYRSPFLSWAVISIPTILSCGHWDGLTSQPSPACWRWLLIYRYCVGFWSLSVPLDSTALSPQSFSEVSLLPGVSQWQLPHSMASSPPHPKICCILLYQMQNWHICSLCIALEMSAAEVSSGSQVELQKSVHPKKCWQCWINSSVKPEWETGLNPFCSSAKISLTSCFLSSVVVIHDEQEVGNVSSINSCLKYILLEHSLLCEVE